MSSEANMAAQGDDKAASGDHNATEGVYAQALDAAAMAFCAEIWGYPRQGVASRALSDAIRAGVREGEDRRYRIRDAVRAETKARVHFDWVVANVCVYLGIKPDGVVEREIGEMSRANEIVLWEDGTIEEAHGAFASLDAHRDLEQRLAAIELRVGISDREAVTPRRGSDPALAPLGDSSGEIAAADQLTRYTLDQPDAQQWAQTLLARAREWLAARSTPMTGAHLRGLVRYLDRARGVVVAEAARLDAEHGRGRADGGGT